MPIRRGNIVRAGLAVLVISTGAWAAGPRSEDVAALAREVRDQGWIVYGARSANGTWDLFMSRPDGTGRHNMTNTPGYEEIAPRFTADGTRLLYRRMLRGTSIDRGKWGFQGELMVADPDATRAHALGKPRQFPWASWSPDGKQIACLTTLSIDIVDVIKREVVRKLPRQGIFGRLFWSPDGAWFCGTANHAGESWTIVRLDAQTAEVNVVRHLQNCTPDWFPDSKHIIHSSRPGGQSGAAGYGYTQLWMGDGDGGDPRLVYGEDGCHIYGGALAPDGRYVLFTKGAKDSSGAEKAGEPMGIMRLADTPIITGESVELRKLHPNTNDGPVLMIQNGWEPTWTFTDVGGL